MPQHFLFLGTMWIPCMWEGGGGGQGCTPPTEWDALSMLSQSAIFVD